MSAAALDLVFRSLGDELRRTHTAALLANHGRTSLDGLLVHCTDGVVEAAIFVELQPGCVASFWGPAMADTSMIDRDAAAAVLIEAGRRWAMKQEIELAQTLLTEDTAKLAEVYHAAGFTTRAELDYLVSNVQDTAESAGNGEIQLAACTSADSESLAALIEQTYEGTQDCPELNGVRSMRHVLAGYANAGDSSENHWFFVCQGAETVGVLLMAEHTAQNQAELVYMGIVPAARGRGYGLALTRLAQLKARQLGRTRMILAVDTRNNPALDLYAQAGFFVFDRRTALLLPLARR